ncbi:MAG: cytochrome c3 family protein [Thermodesulfobacteriota bacterium]
MNHLLRLVFSLLLLLLCWRQTSASAQENPDSPPEPSCIGGDCHPSQRRHVGRELQSEDCRRCHEVSEGHERPAAAEKTTPQVDMGICAGCHPFAGAYWHPPAAANDCQACHVYHSEEKPALRPGNKETICTGCHLAFVESGTMQHITDKDGTKSTDCSYCHSAHVSSFPALLAAPLEGATYVSYGDQTYSFCFSCHNRNMLQFADTMHYTSFRDGKKNLHYIHSNKRRRGINCRVCHEIHQAKAPSLMAERTPYGEWQMPIHFKKTENGGSCAPGCHPLKTYERANYGTTTGERPAAGAAEAD